MHYEYVIEYKVFAVSDDGLLKKPNSHCDNLSNMFSYTFKTKDDALEAITASGLSDLVIVDCVVTKCVFDD